MTAECKYWGVVPAAGSGSRMDAAIPKQYLPLAGQPVLQRTLQAMLDWGLLEKIVIALRRPDENWEQLPLSDHPQLMTAVGGLERIDSVLAGLDLLEALAQPDDWVLVHDAARPCVSTAAVQQLYTELRDDPVGGLLALPVAETLKRDDGGFRVLETLDRGGLWLAQTPQMFRFGLLHQALRMAARSGVAITDEAAAIEWAGHRPRLVSGDPANIKITRPADLALAERYWQAED
ncbi:MAG: 2-C-methyl-D-erythritol 4-phosphate cytidylyltransferase [Halieaceae bacterium]